MRTKKHIRASWTSIFVLRSTWGHYSAQVFGPRDCGCRTLLTQTGYHKSREEAIRQLRTLF